MYAAQLSHFRVDLVVGRVGDGAVAVVVGMVDKLGVVMGSVGKVVDLEG